MAVRVAAVARAAAMLVVPAPEVAGLVVLAHKLGAGQTRSLEESNILPGNSHGRAATQQHRIPVLGS